MITSVTFGELVDLIYRSALDESLWPSFLEVLVTCCGGSGAALLHHKAVGPLHGGAILNSVGVDPAATRGYELHFGGLDPWAKALARGRRFDGDFVVTSESLVSFAELEKTEYYNDFAKAFDIVRNVGCGIATVPTVATTLTIIRGRTHPCFGGGEAAMLAALQPHLRQAFLVHGRLAEAAARTTAAEKVIDDLAIGVVLIDHAGRTAFANREACRLAAADDGFSLTSQGPAATGHSDRLALRRAIAKALGPAELHVPIPLRLTRPSFRRPLVVLVAPLAHGLAFGIPVAGGVALFVSDPDRSPLPSRAVLKALFALTPAETRFAAVVAQGKTVKEAAAELHITINTARWFVRRLLLKTETRNLAELMKALMTGAGSCVVDPTQP